MNGVETPKMATFLASMNSLEPGHPVREETGGTSVSTFDPNSLMPNV
jgi:hypothetical protein